MKSTSKIKVVFCTDGIYPRSVGGMQRHSRLLIEALAASGEIALTVLHPHGDERFFGDWPEVEEVALPPLPGKKHYFLELRDYSKHVLAEVEKRPDHLVYSQGLCVWHGLGKVRDRLIVNPHGLEPFQALGFKDQAKTWPYRIVFRRIFRQAARVVSLGGSLTGILKQAGRPENVVVLPNATQMLPLPDEALQKIRPKVMRFLFVGRFVYNKGIEVLLQSVKGLQDLGHQDRFTLDLAGKGPLFEEMKARFPLPNVNFMGFASDEQLDQAYLDDHVFVLPTLFEGMPTVILEAMARAMPIIVTDTGATLELVGTENGFIIPKNDVSGLQKAMLDLLELPEAQFEAMSAASLHKVRQRFTWSAVAVGHIALFREMWQSF